MSSESGKLLASFKELLRTPSNGVIDDEIGLSIPIDGDISQKDSYMATIRERPYIQDAQSDWYNATQNWIEECGGQVGLPRNFCAGVVIIRFYRRISAEDKQTAEFMRAVWQAAAAYDHAFLALGHADDEADRTLTRNGKSTRHVTHPNTIAVDAINLILQGITEMQSVLVSWPISADKDSAPLDEKFDFLCSAQKIFHSALKEASFPILLDRVGLGHQSGSQILGLQRNEIAPILADGKSLERLAAYNRHRAQTYFLRATEFAAVLAGYKGLSTEFSKALEKLYGHWGALGAATDDLQDILNDFATGTHSACTVLACCSVSEDKELRPKFLRDRQDSWVAAQRERVYAHLGAGDALDASELLDTLREIELKRTLIEYLEARGEVFALELHEVCRKFGYDPLLMVEIAGFVCNDPELRVPNELLSALEIELDDQLREFVSVQAGKYLANYIVSNFWPDGAGA